MKKSVGGGCLCVIVGVFRSPKRKRETLEIRRSEGRNFSSSPRLRSGHTRSLSPTVQLCKFERRGEESLRLEQDTGVTLN